MLKKYLMFESPNQVGHIEQKVTKCNMPHSTACLFYDIHIDVGNCFVLFEMLFAGVIYTNHQTSF